MPQLTTLNFDPAYIFFLITAFTAEDFVLDMSAHR